MWNDFDANIKHNKQVDNLLQQIVSKISSVLKTNCIGIYLHGSLAMNCFNPRSSDIDLLVVTKNPLAVIHKKELASYFLEYSGIPYPIEISFLNQFQLSNWSHPSPYDFHFSELWRDRYKMDLDQNTNVFMNREEGIDPDLAAHITILNNRGKCLLGKPIKELFPTIPDSDYLDSIMGDFEDCLHHIHSKPVYSVLNLIRVYCYVKEGLITSKLEAGHWGKRNLPNKFLDLIEKINKNYTNSSVYKFQEEILIEFRDYMKELVKKR